MSVRRLGDDDHGLYEKLGGPGGSTAAFGDPKGARLLRPQRLGTNQFARIVNPTLVDYYVDVSNIGGGEGGGGEGGGGAGGDGGGEGGDGSGA